MANVFRWIRAKLTLKFAGTSKGIETPVADEAPAHVQRQAAPAETRASVPLRSARATGRNATRKAPPAEVHDVVLGIDWGTSTTKAVARAPFLRGNPAVVLPLTSAAAGVRRFLLPSILYAREGLGSLDATSGGTEIRDIKVRALDRLGAKGDDDEAFYEGTAFLALVVARARLLAAAERQLRNPGGLRLSLNFGMPAQSYDDPNLKSQFLWAARAAARLAREITGTVSFNDARDSYEHFKRGAALDEEDTRVAVHPEFAGAVAAYTYGETREVGLHFLVDVGASTLDAVGFVLFERDDQFRYQILESNVSRLGAFELHRVRLAELRSMNAPIDPSLANDRDPQIIVPASAEDYFPAAVDVQTEIDERFSDRCETPITRICMDIRKRRDRSSRNWHRGVKVFLCGGAARHPVYVDALRKVQETLLKAITIAPLRVEDLPKSPELQRAGISDSDARFFTVAAGLSRPSYLIGVVQPSFTAPDIPDPSQRAGGHFIDKDEV